MVTGYDYDGIFRRGTLGVTEHIINEKVESATLMSFAHTLLCNQLPHELKRVMLGPKFRTTKGQPVHYLLMADDSEQIDGVCNTLAAALWLSGRVTSQRLTKVNADMHERVSRTSIESHYQLSRGGILIFSLSAEDFIDEEFSHAETELLALLGELTERYRHEVLSIFVLRQSAETIRQSLLERMENIKLLELNENRLISAKAREHLRKAAYLAGLSPDRSLYKGIGRVDDAFFTLGDLDARFSNWFDAKLLKSAYPQYLPGELLSCNDYASKPKGSAYRELQSMVGLTAVKETIDEAISYFKMQKILRAKGILAHRPTMHMLFIGNPGTAKTTVARLLAQIMRDNEMLTVGRLIECGRADLVGKYVGSTAPTIKSRFKEAKGSVLLIDEAYSLLDDRRGLFGDEAISTIVQEMETSREETVVVLAGYPEKMEALLKTNPGLRSRISFTVHFDDYSVPELVAIAEHIAHKRSRRLSKSALRKLEKILLGARKQDGFGNGRYVRNLVERAEMRQAKRLVDQDPEKLRDDDLALLKEEDFVIQDNGKKRASIGFTGEV